MNIILRIYVTILMSMIAGQSSGIELSIWFIAFGALVDLGRWYASRGQPEFSYERLLFWRRLRIFRLLLYLTNIVWVAYVVAFFLSNRAAAIHGDIGSNGIIGHLYRLLADAFPLLRTVVREWSASGDIEAVNEACQFALSMACYTLAVATIYSAGACHERAARIITWYVTQTNTASLRIIRRACVVMTIFGILGNVCIYGLFLAMAIAINEDRVPYVWNPETLTRYPFFLAAAGNWLGIYLLGEGFAFLTVYRALRGLSGLESLKASPGIRREWPRHCL